MLSMESGKGVCNMAIELKEKVSSFFSAVAMPKSEFCRRIEISPQALYCWQHDKLNLSDDTLKRIDDFLAKYNGILQDNENK